MCFSKKEHFRVQIQNNIFHVKTDDNETWLSLDDREFMELMDTSFQKDQDGRWKRSYHLETHDSHYQNNRCQALKACSNAACQFTEKSYKEKTSCDVRHGAYHCLFFAIPKPYNIRSVFDSSVKFQGVSLNSVLLSGPKFVNDL